MEFHEAANLFPMKTGDALKELISSMKEYGQQQPILLYEGKILDGRHRYVACLENSIEPIYTDWHGDDPYLYVWLANAERVNILEPIAKALLKVKWNACRAEWHIEQERKRREADRARSEASTGRERRADGTFESSPVSVDTGLARDNRSRNELANTAGVSTATAARAQALYNAAPDLADKVMCGSMSYADANRELKKRKRQKEIEYIAQELTLVADGLFDVIVIDPPWPYGTEYDPNGRRAANPYPEMSLDEIKAIELPAADDCVLWLWTTHKFMRESFAILDAWGFRDVAILTWVKDRMGLGVWLRSQSEFCIMAVKGSPKVNLTNQTTVVNGPLREHSRKPDEFYAMVDELCVGRKCDWFARQARPGWEVYGNEADKFNDN